MDVADLAVQAGGSGVITGTALAVGRLLRWRKEEREEDAKKAAQEKAEKQRKDDDAVIGLLRDALGVVKDRVLKLEGKSDTHDDQIDTVLSVLKETREEILKALADHRSGVHDQMNNLTTLLLKTQGK